MLNDKHPAKKMQKHRNDFRRYDEDDDLEII